MRLGEVGFILIFKSERLGIDGVILVHPLFITWLFIENGLKICDLLAAQSLSPFTMKICLGLIKVPTFSFVFWCCVLLLQSVLVSLWPLRKFWCLMTDYNQMSFNKQAIEVIKELPRFFTFSLLSLKTVVLLSWLLECVLWGHLILFVSWLCEKWKIVLWR